MAYYEFKTIEFGPRVTDHVPQPSASSLFSERRVPYSDITIIDLGGKGANHFQARIRVAPANVTALQGAVQTSGTLILAGISYTATLLSLTNHDVTPGLEWHLYDADWVLTG